jgi:hypothetical protein
MRPHSAWPQPNLVPVMPSTSRPSTSTLWGVPLIFNVKAMAASRWLGLIGRSRPTWTALAGCVHQWARVAHGRTRMIVFPLRRSVGFKAATASSRVETFPMFVRSRPSRSLRMRNCRPLWQGLGRAPDQLRHVNNAIARICLTY